MIKLGQPVFHYESDLNKAEKAEKMFWQKLIFIARKKESVKEKSA